MLTGRLMTCDFCRTLSGAAGMFGDSFHETLNSFHRSDVITVVMNTGRGGA